jgi:methylated-DNA-[protein]-cysteine S-methyltransferase
MTNFEKKVYQAVMSIPLGEVRTYKWVAKKIGLPKSYRAVGNALNKNPWPIIIPCHRVIASGGGLGGYSRTTAKKKSLLDLEKKIKLWLESKK